MDIVGIGAESLDGFRSSMSAGKVASALIVGSVSEGGLLPRKSLFRGDFTGEGGGVGSSSVSGVSWSDSSWELGSSLSLTMKSSSESKLSSKFWAPVSSLCRLLTSCLRPTGLSLALFDICGALGLAGAGLVGVEPGVRNSSVECSGTSFSLS